MRITANGGLVQVTGDTGNAANDDAAVLRVDPPADPRDTSTAAWDPYEVWRTRVKQARPTGDEPESSEHPRDA